MRLPIVLPPSSEYYPWVLAFIESEKLPPTKQRNEMQHRILTAALLHSDARRDKQKNVKPLHVEGGI